MTIRDPQVDVHRHRGRRRRTARQRSRPRRPGPANRGGLQVAAGQGAHRHGRGRHGRGHGQRLPRGQLAGALPRHHARRQDAQQLAHGPAPRPGVARPGPRARELGRAVRPHPDGRILQRDFGGHRYARLAHVGDRTGLELIRTLQQKAVADGIDVFMECKVLRLLHDADGTVSRRASATGARPASSSSSGPRPWCWPPAASARAGSTPRTRGSRTGDGHAMALWAGADLIDMECVQFHPTGMVWPLSVRGILVTEGVRGDGGVLRNSEGKRFMFDYVPDMFRAETADSEEEADKWYDDHTAGRRPPELLPRDEVARSINSEVKAGRGSPHGGVFLDIASRRTAEDIRRRLPSMYHQFMELAGVDITAEAMEVGPTCHYIMGGVRVDADTAAATVPGLFAAGEVAGGMHGANRLGGNSLSDLLVFGRRAGIGAAEFAEGRAGRRAARARADRTRPSTRPWPPSSGRTARTPTTSSRTCRRRCRAWSGIIRTGPRARGGPRQARASSRSAATNGRRQGRPATTTRAGTWPPTCRRCSPSPRARPWAPSTARRAGAATPGTTTRGPTPRWARSTSSTHRRPVGRRVTVHRGRSITSQPEPLPAMPDDLRALLEEAH